MLSELFTLLLLYQNIRAATPVHDFSRPWITVSGKISPNEYQQYKSNAYPIKQAIADLPESFQLRLRSNCSDEQRQYCLSKECIPNKLVGTTINVEITAPTTNAAPYRCQCGNDTLLDFVNQNRIQARCVKRTSCDECDPDHTVKCLESGDGTHVSCICEPDYMEDSNCKKKKNGCEETHTTASLKGNVACRVSDGNLCISMAQSLKYSCVCRSPFSEDKRLSFPNCMRNDTPCQRPLCLGFQPPISDKIPGPSITIDQDWLNADYSSSSDDCNETAICNCPDGWLGRHCSEQRGEAILGSWSPWSTCNPDCIMPNDRSLYSRMAGIHAGTSRATGIGYRSRFSRCTMNDQDYCVGTYRFWRRCRVTSLCNSFTNTRLSTVVNDAIGKAMIEHDKSHRPEAMEPIMTAAAGLTWSERHYINFITVAASLIYSCISIWILELHHMILFWSKPVS